MCALRWAKVKRANSEEDPQRFDQREIASGHVDLKDETLSRRPILEWRFLRRYEERAFGSDEAAECEADRVPGLDEPWKKLGGGDGN
jgi:hypothetical protein